MKVEHKFKVTNPSAIDSVNAGGKNRAVRRAMKAEARKAKKVERSVKEILADLKKAGRI